MQNLISLVAAILLAGLLHFERKHNQKGRLTTKSVLSSLFILTAVTQSHPIPGYYHFILAGLVFCLGGDVFLVLPQKRMFLLGLVSFLVGHVFYILGFFYVSQTSLWTWLGSISALTISTLVFLWLSPHLGSMKLPVLLYVVVITIMVAGAWSVLGASDLARSGRVMVFVGALCFYFSDVFVARDRFLKKVVLHRTIPTGLLLRGIEVVLLVRH
jgi:uncharacterized membrane protein YhhN